MTLDSEMNAALSDLRSAQREIDDFTFRSATSTHGDSYVLTSEDLDGLRRMDLAWRNYLDLVRRRWSDAGEF
jgi:hypothetical protein